MPEEQLPGEREQHPAARKKTDFGPVALFGILAVGLG
jgi:hypothetical protein